MVNGSTANTETNSSANSSLITASINNSFEQYQSEDRHDPLKLADLNKPGISENKKNHSTKHNSFKQRVRTQIEG